MRIDGPSSFSLERSTRPGSAATPLRDVQREVERRGEQPAQPSASQGYEVQAQVRRVQESYAAGEIVAARGQENFAPPGLHAKAYQALSAYSTTATYTESRDANQVLGLDLYA